jgi:rSAM/selenodomain-associated transferase 2
LALIGLGFRVETIRFSIIVPVLHESDRINQLVDHLFNLENAQTSEIIVIDGSPKRDTINALQNNRVIKIISEKGRAIQMNTGASVAKGEILIFLHADTELPVDALTKIGSVMRRNKYVGGAFKLGIKSEQFIYKALAYWVSIRCYITRIPYGDQAIFIRKDYFNNIGCYPNIPLMEDVELMRRIKKRGYKICIIPDPVMTSPRRWEKEGFIYVNLRNMVLLILYLLGVSPEKLAHFYKTNSRKSTS